MFAWVPYKPVSQPCAVAKSTNISSGLKVTSTASVDSPSALVSGNAGLKRRVQETEKPNGAKKKRLW